MPYDLIAQANLDTISSQLLNINNELLLLKKGVSEIDTSETILIVLSAISPIVVGVILFTLNKNKDFHSKKSELSGEINSKINELNVVITNNTHLKMTMNGNAKKYELSSDEKYNYTPSNDDELSPNEYANLYHQANKEMDGNLTKHKQILSKLLMASGIFRLYLPRTKRKKYDDLMENVKSMRAIDYTFSDYQSIIAVDNEMKRIRTNYKNDLRQNYSLHIKQLQEFIDENCGSDFLIGIE